MKEEVMVDHMCAEVGFWKSQMATAPHPRVLDELSRVPAGSDRAIRFLTAEEVCAG